MIKLLIDESAGLKLKKRLSKIGIDAVSIIEINKGAKDREILKLANQEGRIIVTNDKDFGELVYREYLEHKGIILLRLTIDSPENRFSVVMKLIEQFGDKLINRFCVVDETRVRFRAFSNLI